MRRAAVALCLLLASAPGARAQDGASVDLLEAWVAAVKAHQPGTPDAPARLVAGMTYADRFRLHPAMEIFLVRLHRGPGSPGTRIFERIFELVRSVSYEPGIARFLRRAAILHADVAIHRSELPPVPDDAPVRVPVQPGEFMAKDLPPPPLLYNDRYVLHNDGRVIGDAPGEWSWPFARYLLDQLLSRASVRQPEDVRFVSAWYHAVAAHLFAASRHGDLNTHLQHGALVIPRDPYLFFDRACFAEMLGLPIYQALNADPTNRFSMARLAVDVPSAGKTDAEAEGLFRRALQVLPDYAEARVRLARLLEARGRLDEASQEIEKALAGQVDSEVSFYARLFAGRIAQGRGHPEEALGHYSAASTLYPDAQSALLGASQAAVMTADLPAALSFAQRLSPRSETSDSDPWWRYRLGAGRDADALLAAVYAASR